LESLMHYHIVGIGGAGMSAIAHLLLDQGNSVSGSDLARNALTEALAARGARIAQGHSAAHVAGADALVSTSAARPEHPELQAARAAGIPLLKRADLWRDWSQHRSIIAVAGTHGKTTTTAMVASILLRAGLNPGFLVGGSVPALGGNARWGNPAAPLVIEADEYDRTFLALRPAIAVVTNIEWDHVDIYPTPESYREAFAEFVAASRTLIADEQVWLPTWLLGPPTTAAGGVAHDGGPIGQVQRLISYGFDRRCTWTVDAPRFEHGRTYVHAHWQGEAPLDVRFALHVAGTHNVRNAVAALAVAHTLGLNLAEAGLALLDFRGAERRFQLKGEAGGVTVIDDYAHHPTEARATLEAARMRYGARRLVVYLQPHTYSRTRALLDAWPAAFAAADVVLVGAIYGAREESGADISAAQLAERIARVHPNTRAVGDLEQATAALNELLRPGDVLLTLGAGDGHLVGEWVLGEL
jgi:UDP-N-acetylmuramate--alanine ligase